MHGYNVSLAWVFGIDKNIIQIYDDEDIEIFYQNLIDIALEACWDIG